MTEISGGELFVRCLANEGVEFVFGLPCPEVDPILAALEDHGIRFVPVRHEAAAVHMAEGLYKTGGRVAAVIGNPGPGSANLLPGVITARHEGVPVLVLTAQHRLGVVYPSPPTTFQGQDQLDVFRPTVKWGGRSRVGAHSEIVRMAFREMDRTAGPSHRVPDAVVYATGDPRRLRSARPRSTARRCRSPPTRSCGRPPRCWRAPNGRSSSRAPAWTAPTRTTRSAASRGSSAAVIPTMAGRATVRSTIRSISTATDRAPSRRAGKRT
jgi:thiamine pyrophosphate-dependent acetolactate synthase large subunit-like protein